MSAPTNLLGPEPDAGGSIIKTPAPPAPETHFREFGDHAKTRQLIYSNVLKAAQNLEPLTNKVHTLKLNNPHYEDKDHWTVEERKHALLTGGTIARRLYGTWEMSDNATGKVIDQKHQVIARVPHLTDLGTFVNGGNDYTLCLHPTVQIWTEQGMMQIGRIVKEKLRVRVWSYDFTSAQFVLRKVTGWHEHQTGLSLGRAVFHAPARLSEFYRFNPTTLWATPNHNVYRQDGTLQRVGKVTSLTVVEETLTSCQEQLVYGTMLGDAHIDRRGLYRAIHCVAQKDYAAFKQQALGPVGGSQLTEYVSEGRRYVRFASRAHTAFYAARSVCYRGKTKRVTAEWLAKLDVRGLAFWFCDDGSARYTAQTTHAEVALHCCGFIGADVTKLQTWLKNKFGLHSYRERYEKTYRGRNIGWVIRVSGESAQRFLDLVAPYVPTCLHYKLLARPVTGVCARCASSIRPTCKFCLTCLAADASAPGALSKTIRSRFGSTQAARAVAGQVLVESDGTDRWQARINAAGSGLPAFTSDTRLILRLRTVPAKFVSGTGACYENQRTVYDLTVDGTHNYFANGVLVSNSNQQRLQPGVYARRKENGELESHFNVMPGKGISHRYLLDPEKGIFKIKVAQSEMPVLPLLRAMGVTDGELREHWGDKLFQSNQLKSEGGVLRKLQDKMLSKEDREHPDESHRRQKLVDAFHNMELDPDVTKYTLGHPHKNVDKTVILKATQKLLAINRGEAEVDDRDHLAYQRFLGPEDLIAERIARDHGRVRRKLFMKASLKGHLQDMPSSGLTPQVEQALLGSGLGQALEEINPSEVLDKQSKISRMGEGGIPSLEAVPDEARGVQPSHMAFMDPVRTPECYDRDSEVMTRNGWVPWPLVTDEDEFACLVDGEIQWHRASRLHVADYCGELLGVRTATLEYLVTPNHRLWVRPVDVGSKYRIETAEESFYHPRAYHTGGPVYAGSSEAVTFDIPDIDRPGNNTTQLPSFALDAWAELLGWYIGEGCTVWRSPPGDYRVLISQSLEKNHANCLRIERLLHELKLPWSYNVSMQTYVLCGKQLTAFFLQFGESPQRFLPEEVFDWRVSARQRLLEALLLAEGRRNRNGRRYEFCSTSVVLAEQVQRLAFGLGLPTTMSFEKDERQPQYLGCWVVHLQQRTERQAFKRNYFKEDYDGPVYCATVPGGLLYVRRGRTSGHWSGNSFKVGVDVNMARNARKGADGRIYSQFTDPRTQKPVWKSPQDLHDAVIAFPGGMEATTKRIPVMKGGKIDYATKDEVDYVSPHAENWFSHLGNMVPLKSASKAQRMAMASRMLTQSLPLSSPEAPLVQSAMPGTQGQRSFEEEYGQHMGAIYAPAGGRVLNVDKNGIKVKYEDGHSETHELYNNYPFNRKTSLHHTSLVQQGDTVAPNQLLAHSNFTDKNGVTALGTNLNVAWVPWKGTNFQDAITISKSAAMNKLRSEHSYHHEVAVDDKSKLGKNAFISLFPGAYDKQLLANLDDKGVVRPGTTVEYGHPLILAAQERDRADNKVHKQRQAGYHDQSVIWKHHDPGVVTDVVMGKNGPVVLVKSSAVTQVGDKLANRFGGKGVIGAILEDHQMPHDKNGVPYEALLNPLGTISRGNSAQNIETWLGKVAKHTGKTYKAEDFGDINDWTEHAQEQLRRHGLSATEDIVDPTNGTKIPNIATGHSFFMKLHHSAESKTGGRSGGSYSMDETPARGGATGCFIGTTRVQTNRGFMTIERIVKQQLRIDACTRALDPGRSGQPAWWCPITDWFCYFVLPEELLEIRLTNGHVLTCTRNHELILANGERILVQDLKSGFELWEN